MASILDSLLAHLDACTTPQIEEAAKASNVPFHTIAKIKRRDTLNPRIDTVQRLLEYFQAPRRKSKTMPATAPARGEAQEAAHG